MERPLDPLLVPDDARLYWLVRGRDIVADLRETHAIWRARQEIARTAAARSAGLDLAVVRDMALAGCGACDILAALGCGDEWLDAVRWRVRMWRRYGWAVMEAAAARAYRAARSPVVSETGDGG